jgi:hypothetical protein
MTPMNMTSGCWAEGIGVSRAIPVRTGTLSFLPNRTETE